MEIIEFEVMTMPPVLRCSSCGKKHEGLTANKLKTPAIVGDATGAFDEMTHVFQCPETSESVYIKEKA